MWSFVVEVYLSGSLQRVLKKHPSRDHTFLYQYVWLYLFEGEALREIVFHMGYPTKHKDAFVYSAADIYFSAITPSASGGQPASAFFMIKTEFRRPQLWQRC